MEANMRQRPQGPQLQGACGEGSEECALGGESCVMERLLYWRLLNVPPV